MLADKHIRLVFCHLLFDVEKYALMTAWRSWWRCTRSWWMQKRNRDRFCLWGPCYDLSHRGHQRSAEFWSDLTGESDSARRVLAWIKDLTKPGNPWLQSQEPVIQWKKELSSRSAPFDVGFRKPAYRLWPTAGFLMFFSGLWNHSKSQ